MGQLGPWPVAGREKRRPLSMRPGAVAGVGLAGPGRSQSHSGATGHLRHRSPASSGLACVAPGRHGAPGSRPAEPAGPAAPGDARTTSTERPGSGLVRTRSPLEICVYWSRGLLRIRILSRLALRGGQCLHSISQAQHADLPDAHTHTHTHPSARACTHGLAVGKTQLVLSFPSA